MRGSDEDYSMATRARLVDRLRVLLAGRAAEEVPPPLFPDCLQSAYGKGGEMAVLTQHAQETSIIVLQSRTVK